MSSKYEKNLFQWIDSLPYSNIRLLYFRKANVNVPPYVKVGDWLPQLSTRAKVWEQRGLQPASLYVSHGFTTNYCYVHKDSGIKYDVYLDQMQNVTGFQQTSKLTPADVKAMSLLPLKGGNTVQANWGTHYTIGVEYDEDTSQWMMNTQLTNYVPMKSKPDKYRKDVIQCDIPLLEPLKRKTLCYESNRRFPRTRTMESYEMYGNDYHAVPIMQAIQRKIVHGKLTGGSYITYQGKKCKLHQGVRGGRYIEWNGRKIYMKGGNSDDIYQHDGFTDEFITFFKQYHILRIREESMKYLTEVILVDDTESDHILIQYNENYGELDRIESYIFLMKRSFVKAAFQASRTPVEKQTMEQKEIIERFGAPMTPIKLPPLILAY